jgi:opacity protein-like surface antigen
MRARLICGIVCVAAVAVPVTASAQGQSFGIGGRFSWVQADVDADLDSQRFAGGQIRARMSPRTALELSLDLKTETNEAETLRVRQMPIQASLLLYPVRSVFSPFVLGGAGWYATRVELLAGDETLSSETTREFGWHGGFGAELRLGPHAGLHADYRYTFLDFGDDDDDEDADASAGLLGGLGSRFLPGYRGSMWTAGLTLYF